MENPLQRALAWIGKACTGLVLLVCSVASVYPIIWMVATSLRTNSDVLVSPWGLPRSFLWQNFVTTLERSPIPRYFLNSVIVSGSSVTLIVIVSSMAAYAFARLTFKLRSPLFYLCLMGLAIPPQIALVPLFIINNKTGIANTYLALIGPDAAFGIPFGILVIRSFMLTLPKELEDAAELDGCSRFALFWRIYLPLSRPALAVVAVFSFVGTWNEFLFALTFVNKPELKTLPVGLMDFIGEFTTQWPLMAAGMVLATIPMIVFYILMQKRLMEAMTTGAVRG
jgi:raffinose/stachyose/melibiose transport system permease protein